jgi:hypothetical protein
MHPGSAPHGAGTIVFVRSPSACDTSDFARVVDADGRFVGVLGPGTYFAVPNTPGEQIFYVWPGLDLRLDLHPEFHPVDMIRVRAGEGDTTYVGVRVHVYHKLKCFKYAVYHFTRPTPDELAEWMPNARELVPDAQEGSSLLERDGDVTRAYMAMAREKREKGEALGNAASGEDAGGVRVRQYKRQHDEEREREQSVPDDSRPTRD